MPPRTPLLILAAFAVVAGVSTTAARPTPQAFAVKSSLDGKRTLPHRIHWLGFPSLPRTKIAEVAFIIDGGKPRWIEHNPPYVYSDDGGFLVTTAGEPPLHGPCDGKGRTHGDRHRHGQCSAGPKAAGAARGEVATHDRHRDRAQARNGRQPHEHVHTVRHVHPHLREALDP